MKLSNLWTQPLCATSPATLPTDDHLHPDVDDDYGSPLDHPFPTQEGRRNRFRFVTTPDGESDLIPASISEQEWADAFEEAETASSEPIATNDNSAVDGVQTIAQAVLSACPDSLAAIALDGKGRLLGATITQAPKGITPAVFRAAFRSLPERCKSVKFAAQSQIASDVRDAATQAGEHFLVRVQGYLALS